MPQRLKPKSQAVLSVTRLVNNMDWVFTPATTPFLHVAQSQARYPVQRIFCVGRNYVEHAQEMGHTGREDPFFFCKPAQAILNVDQGTQHVMPYPSETADLHHEVELVVALAKGGKNLTIEQAIESIYGYAIGLDMTRRDLQAEAKKLGRPWELGKAFDASAVIGPLHPISETGVIDKGRIALEVNGQTRQVGDISQLIWNVAESIAYLSRYFALLPGDVLMTGTPAGVGAVVSGDTLLATIDGLGQVQVTIQ